MQDITWRDQREPWERLRWARLRWQRDAGAVGGSAKDAAESMGMNADTYRAYERAPGTSKHTRLDDQAAARFARKFKVSWQWLLTGRGTPFDEEEMSPAQERMLRATTGLDQESQEALASMVETFARARITARG
jgi:hypothetical protein